MPTALLIEDESPALRRLESLLAAVQPPVTVVGTADSLAAAEKWLAANPAPELIFADIQLGDGLSVEFFRRAPPPAPVIFTTAHNAYVLEAFAAHGIAYLLKPVKSAELAEALGKHSQLARQYAARGGADFAALAQALAASAEPSGRRRILAQRGPAHVPVALEDVAYFFSADKLTFLMTRAGEKALVNEPLATLETELARGEFFRLNRNFLARAAAVRSFTSVGKGRLTLQLTPPAPEEVLVSQERAAEFKAWVSDAPRT